MTKTSNMPGNYATSIVVNPNLDTPTNVLNIAEWLQKPDLMTKLNGGGSGDMDLIASDADYLTTSNNMTMMGGGAITVLNPNTGVYRIPDSALLEVDTDKIPVVINNQQEEVELKLPEPVVQTNRKRTMMTRSLSRQVSEKAIKVEKDDDDNDSDWEPEDTPPRPAKRGRRSVAGRKPNGREDGLDHLPAEEREKVILRRQKNKEAAARCRQKRVDLTNTLAKQVEAEQAAKKKLELEIKKLRSQQAMYQRILGRHKAAGCCLAASDGTENNNYQSVVDVATKPAIAIAVKSAPVIVEAVNAPYVLPMEAIAPEPEQQPLIKPPRPQTLGLTVSKPKSLFPTLKEEQPETPSKGLFDGFTPTSIFGNIVPALGTPTCSVQQRSSEFSDLNTPQIEGHSLTAL